MGWLTFTINTLHETEKATRVLGTLDQYLQNFYDEGFDTWEVVLYITESDLEHLKVKLGHRRKLQREIAKARGISFEQLQVWGKRPSGGDEVPSPEVDERIDHIRSETKPSGASGPGGKRKYRRHPKPDENAPARPQSAYVLFSNKIRDVLREDNLSFTEIAKIVGERWQALAPAVKEPYESQANSLKEEYNAELMQYKKTEEYQEYVQYLREFKRRHGTTATEGKRPRLEAEPSTASSASTSSMPHESSYTPYKQKGAYGRQTTRTKRKVAYEHKGSIPTTRGGLGSPVAVSSSSTSPVQSVSSVGYPRSELEPSRLSGFPRLAPLDGRERETQNYSTLLPQIKADPSLPPLQAGLISSSRRSNSRPASFLTNETTGTTASTSRSSNFSTGSFGSAQFSPSSSIDEPIQQQRQLAALPPFRGPILGAGDQPTLPAPQSLYPSSMPGQLGPNIARQAPYIPTSTEILKDRPFNMRNLSLESPYQPAVHFHEASISSYHQQMRDPNAKLVSPSSQAPPIFPSPMSALHQHQMENGGGESKKRDSDSPPDTADPLSVLAQPGALQLTRDQAREAMQSL
ncbi:hypothetical protein MMC25_000130 [Agyrium rufum]|nr:hypothetical protein [Agyrium rufum]